MTIDRVATNAQSQYMLSQIMQSESAMNTSEQQVASGKVATTYGGIGDKTQLLEAARSAADQASAQQNALQIAATQTDLQNTQLDSFAGLASSLKQDITEALANNDASTLMSDAQSIYSQAAQLLNSQDANGNYIYGGNNDSAPPVTVSSLSDLASLSSVSDAFANGTVTKSVSMGNGQTAQVGLLASDLGTQLFTTLQQIAQFNSGPDGDLGSGLSTAQQNFLTGQASAATTTYANLNNIEAANGDTYNQLNDAVTQQQSLSTLYQGFVSNLENVDMGTAITQLNQNQVAYQAALQVTAQLNQLSLLNFLPAPSSTG